MTSANASSWPSVGVVVPTHERPKELREALAAILAQDYPGRLVVTVVFDGSEPDESLRGEQVSAIANVRTPGLAGARNSGICSLDTDLVAFCDDDDQWLPGKLQAQVEALVAADANFVTCSVVFGYDGAENARLAGTTAVTHRQLLRSRMAMLHSSTFVIRRTALLEEIGLVSETIPRGQSEDWDLLLRASAQQPIVHVDRPLVHVSWGNSQFARDWEAKTLALQWLLQHHPDLAADRRAAARVYGKLAFAQAALGERRRALGWSTRALARNPLESRAYIATLVALRLTTSDAVLHRLHRRGHGI